METVNAAQFLSALGRISMQAGVLVLVVLLAQWLFRRQLTPRWRCALWLLVVVRLMLPLSLTSSASIFNWLPDWNRRTTPATSSPGVNSTPAPASLETSVEGWVDQPVVTREIPSTPSVVGVETAEAAGPMVSVGTDSKTPATEQISWTTVAVVIWFVGVMALLTHVLVSSIRLARRFAHLPPLTDPAVLAVLADCRRLLGVRARLVVVESGDVSSPALQGLIHPQLLLPKKFAGNFSLRELRHIFLHELAHVKRRDLWMNWLMALLQVAHWFNPLVWIAFIRWRADRELACDALALEAAGAGHNKEYGQTILRLLESFSHRSAMPGMVGILEDKRQLRRRIQMITNFKPSSRWSLLAWLLMVVISAGCLTDAKLQSSGGRSHATGKTEPRVIDLSRFLSRRFVENGKTNSTLAGAGVDGNWVLDGLPFQVAGQIVLYGQKEVKFRNATAKKYPDVIGLPVGRQFDELHLLHETLWADVEGEMIAIIRLNYADGTKQELPINYGEQVREWARINNEETEALGDPNTKIVWRGPENAQLVSPRVFKSRLSNPFPQKEVVTLDFVSTRRLSSYVVLAATVANRDSHRPVTPPLATDQPKRHFDGRLIIHVLDKDSDAPLSGAVLEPFMDVDQSSWAAAPLYTSSKGEGVIRYPKGRISYLFINVSKQGYAAKRVNLSGDYPEAFTFRLMPAIEKIGGIVLDENNQPVNLKGRTVKGQLKRSADLAPDVDFGQFSLMLQPDVPQPEVPEGLGPDKIQKWYQDWMKTDAGWKYVEALHKQSQLQVKADGTFSAATVTPGKYKLNGNLWQNGSVQAQIEGQDVVVPEASTNDSDTPFDLGTITVKAVKHLNVGDLAPDFSTKTLDGQPLKLSDFRGKYVLLDFWATWCGPCVAEMPNLKAIYDAYGKDERFVMISLSLDPDAAAPKKFVQDKNLQWLQGFLGDWLKDAVSKNYISGLPSIFLIGPDGKVIAQDLRDTRIKEVVGSALTAH